MDLRINTRALLFSALLSLTSYFFLVLPRGANSEEKVRICFGITAGHLSEASIKDTRSAFDLWLKKLVQKKGHDVGSEVRFYATVDELDKAIAKGEINCIGLSVIEYLSSKHKNQLIPGLSYFRHGSPYESYLLLVHKDSPYMSLRNLKGKSIVVEEGKKGFGPLYWLDTALLNANLPCHEKFFSVCKIEENASKSAIPLYFKQVDGCVISRSSFKILSEMNPQCGKNLRVLSESPPLLQNMVCLTKSFPEREREDFISVGSNLSRDVEGQQILMLFQLDALIPFKEEHLKSAEQLKYLHDSLTGRLGKK